MSWQQCSALLTLSALAAGVLTRLLMSGAERGWRLIPVDVPNERSLHAKPIPRCGGLAILAVVLVIAGVLPSSYGALTLAALLLAALSYVDDLRSLPVILRLLVHFGTAALFVMTLKLPVGWSLTVVVCVVAAMNFTNFMDGANGLVGSSMLVALGTLAIVAGQAGDTHLLLLCLGLCGALIGFLVFNLPHGLVFLGDAGSVPLGFLAAAIGIEGHTRGVWSISLLIMMFLPLYGDALTTLLRRAWIRQPVWRAHREHVYQRLVQCGWSHTRVAAGYAVATLLCALVGIGIGALQGPELFVLLMAFVFSVLFGFLFVGSRLRPAAATKTQ